MKIAGLHTGLDTSSPAGPPQTNATGNIQIFAQNTHKFENRFLTRKRKYNRMLRLSSCASSV